jgi:hypothetical protein
VPEFKQPKQKQFAIVTSKLNSDIKGFIVHKKTPTQKPTHIGQ